MFLFCGFSFWKIGYFGKGVGREIKKWIKRAEGAFTANQKSSTRKEVMKLKDKRKAIMEDFSVKRELLQISF